MLVLLTLLLALAFASSSLWCVAHAVAAVRHGAIITTFAQIAHRDRPVAYWSTLVVVLLLAVFWAWFAFEVAKRLWA